MIDPYRMVVVNVACSLVLVFALLFYKYIYPKKDINLFYVLIFISLLPLISILRKGTYESGDLSLHSLRSMLYFDILIGERALPRWTPDFNAQYGDPHFLFSYLLPYFIVSILHLIGISFINSVKILLASSFILSGVFMYVWIKNQFGKKAGFVSAVFYLFIPYHLVDLHFRVTIAENLSFVFLPINMYFTKKLIEKESMTWVMFLALGLTLLILSHQVISVSFLPILVLYGVLLLYKKKRNASHVIQRFLAGIVLSLLLSCFYWLPIVLEAKFTQNGIFTPPIAFPEVWQLFFSMWRYGLLFQGPKGELSYLLGYTQWVILLLTFIFILRKKFGEALKLHALFFFAISIVLLFLILPVSKPIWDILPFFKFFQYSTRLLVVTSLCIAVLAGILVKRVNKTWFLLALCMPTIMYTILNWGNRRVIPEITDISLMQGYKRGIEDISGLEPSSPKWADVYKKGIKIRPAEPIEILEGDGRFKQIFRSSTKHEYLIEAKSNLLVKENTLYFPGWTLYANNKLHSINYTTKEFPGVITFRLNEGLYKAELVFKDTPVRTFSFMVSFASWILVASTVLILSLRKMFRKTVVFKSIS